MELSGQLHAPATVPPGETKDLSGHWSREKYLVSAWNGTSVVHPVADRYADWAIWEIDSIVKQIIAK